MLKTCAEISRLKGCTRQNINKFLKQNNIAPAGKKGKLPTYDCSQEPLVSYLSNSTQKNTKKLPNGQNMPAKNAKVPQNENAPVNIENHPKSEKPSKREIVPKSAISPEPAPGPYFSTFQNLSARISKPLNELLADKIPAGRKPSSMFYAKAMKLAEENADAALLFKLGQIADKEDRDELYQQQMLKTEEAKEQIAQEKAERLKIENRIRIGEYMDKRTVKLLFGKTYAVHTSILTPLGLKLSDMLNAIPPGPERRIKIQEMIDNEIFAALGSIKSIMIDFVTTENDVSDELKSDV